MDDARLKEAVGMDYFDELLERIRDIRASENRFYQKVKDVFTQASVDYDPRSDTATSSGPHRLRTGPDAIPPRGAPVLVQSKVGLDAPRRLMSEAANTFALHD